MKRIFFMIMLFSGNVLFGMKSEVKLAPLLAPQPQVAELLKAAEDMKQAENLLKAGIHSPENASKIVLAIETAADDMVDASEMCGVSPERRAECKKEISIVASVVTGVCALIGVIFYLVKNAK